MKQIKEIIILGTGGNAIDILDLIDAINKNGDKKYLCAGFLDDDPSLKNTSIHGIKVLGSLSEAQQYKESFFVNGICNTKNFYKRENIIAKSKLPLHKFITLIHPTASISSMAKIGKGVVIFQNVSVCSHAIIGNHVMILPNSIISHDDVLEDYVYITAGVCLAGNVMVGKSSYIGTNSSIKEQIKIGESVLVGMGSTVLKDVPSNNVVVGNPAKLLKKVK